MYSIKDRWTIESEMIYKSKDRLLIFDKLSAIYFKTIWMNLKQESLADHMFRKFPQYDNDPSFFFSSGCDHGTQCDVICDFNFNLNHLEIIKVMNFFFWIKNSLGLRHFMTFFDNNEIIMLNGKHGEIIGKNLIHRTQYHSFLNFLMNIKKY